MNDALDIPFSLNDPGNVLVRHGEQVVAKYVIGAILHVFNVPLAALIGGVAVDIHNAVMNIKFELNQQRINYNIATQIMTARKFSTALDLLARDGSWHPEVKRMLEAQLTEILVIEFRRSVRV